MKVIRDSTVSRGVMSYYLVEWYQSLGGPCCIHLKTLNNEASRFVQNTGIHLPD